MDTKTFRYILILVLIATVLLFGYKLFASHVQQDKEIEVIKARQAEKNAQEKKVTDCIAAADKKRGSAFELGFSLQKSKFEKQYGIRVADRNSIPEQNVWQSMVMDPATELADDIYETAKADCYKLYK